MAKTREELIEQYVADHMARAEREFRADAELLYRTCPVCGYGFMPGRCDQVYCSSRCSKRMWDIRHGRAKRD